MKALGVDLGSKRIGLAICDSSGILATPLSVLERSGNRRSDHKRLLEIAQEERVDCLVVGLPVDLKGREALAAKDVLAEVGDLATVMGVPVHTHDERMTTAAASRAFRGAGSKKRKANIDAAAAAMILQGWLDARS